MNFRKQFEKEIQTKVNESSLQDYIEWIEGVAKNRGSALEHAKLIIENYEMDIKNSDWVGINLEAKGFCQGSAYKNALSVIEKLEKEEKQNE